MSDEAGGHRYRVLMLRPFRRLPFRRPMGLRARVITVFALGASLMSVSLTLSTYVTLRHTLLKQEEVVSERQASVNARLVRSGLRTPHPDVPKLLDSLENHSDTHALLQYQGNWFSTDSINFGQTALPIKLREMVQGGTAARMRYRLGSANELAVGIPVPGVTANYFEITSSDELERTLPSKVLELTLIIAPLITILGGIALGRWVAQLVLQPVAEAASAAEAIASGDMGTRLGPNTDADLDRLVQSFNHMVDALQGRIERDARFASDVSHELRSPLMTLSSGLSVMQSRRQELPPRSQTALDLLADEIQRFQRMVIDLLEISRSDGGHLDISLEEIRLGEFVARVIEGYEREIPVEAEAGVSDVILLFDKRRMERVIGNLIENADRYAGGVIRIGIEWAGPKVRIVVDDAGPGVPPEERTRIFERFARGTTARSRASGEGTGLGLSLVDEHVRLHKGRVWVEDRPEGGARFIVELPGESL